MKRLFIVAALTAFIGCSVQGSYSSKPASGDSLTLADGSVITKQELLALFKSNLKAYQVELDSIEAELDVITASQLGRIPEREVFNVLRSHRENMREHNLKRQRNLEVIIESLSD